MTKKPVLDLSRLPTYGFGPASPMWWGTLGFMAIEGTGFALAIATYFYLRGDVQEWPPHLPPPDWRWGTLNLVVFLASLVPNHLAKRAGEKEDIPRIRLWLGVTIAFAVAAHVVRYFEFVGLNCRWDANAYGSIVWAILGLHTVHLLTDMVDSVVLLALFFAGPIEGKRFSDVSENSFYWDFVVGSWALIYAVLYIAPRLL